MPEWTEPRQGSYDKSTGLQSSSFQSGCLSSNMSARHKCLALCEDPVLELPVSLLSPKIRKELSFANI